MTFPFYIFIFLFGLAVGSFLNVLIYRLTKEEGIGGRSYCPKCKHQLAWQDLVPVLSFFLLRGRCRYCGRPISWQYPIVEIITALLFLLIFNFQFSIFNEFSISQFPNFPISGFANLIYLLFITSCLIVIFVSDLKYFIIPDGMIIAGIVFVLIFWILNLGFVSDFGFRVLDLKNLLNPLLAALGASAFFLIIVVATKGKGMGLGDVKMAFFMGLVLGWPQILPAFLLAFVSGALVGLALILAGKAKMKSEIPFGTFLAASTFLILIFGSPLLQRYMELMF